MPRGDVPSTCLSRWPYSFAAALAHVSTVVAPPEPAAQYLGVGLRQPSQRHTCDGLLGAMAIRHAALNDQFFASACFFLKKKLM
jgi:hypothetical protein